MNDNKDTITKIKKELKTFLYDFDLDDRSVELNNMPIKKSELPELVKKINKKFNINVDQAKLRNISFENLTLYIKELVIEKYLKTNKVAKQTIQKAGNKRYYKLSFAQERMFLIYKYEPNSNFYNMNIVGEFGPELDIGSFKKAVSSIFDRHDIFKTNFKTVNGEPVQFINRKHKLKIKDMIVSKKEIDSTLNNEMKVVFDLEKDCLFKVSVIRGENKNDTATILFILHHIIFDGWSMRVFTDELSLLYDRISKNAKAKSLPIEIQYRDYAEHERSVENIKEIQVQEKFWSVYLKERPPLLDLYTDKNRETTNDFNGAVVKINIEKEVVKKLKGLAIRSQTTLFSVLLMAYGIFLYKVFGHRQMIIGAVFANRQSQDLDKILGVFINNIPIKIEINDNISVTSLLNKVKNDVLRAGENSAFPFEKIIEKFDVGRNPGLLSLFNTMFQYDPVISNKNKFSDMRVINNNTAKFDMKARAIERRNDEVEIQLEYNSGLFFEKTIRNYSQVFLQVLTEISNDSKRLIDDINILSHHGRKLPVSESSAIVRDIPDNIGILELFEKMVRKYPAKTALVCNGKKLSYKELNISAGKTADKLIGTLGNKKNGVVAIATNRDHDMIVSVIGALKAGCAFILVNNDYPSDRIKFLLKDSDTNILVMDSDKSKMYINCTNVKVININDKATRDKKEASKNKRDGVRTTGNDTACIIYTSGTTGKPKGTELSHTGVIDNIYQRIGLAKLTSKDIFCFIAPLEFVGAPHNILLPLLLGATLHIYPDHSSTDILKLFAKIDKDKISNLEVNPYRLSSFVEVDKDESSSPKFKYLKSIFIPGAKTNTELRKKISSRFPITKQFIVYGCSEYSFAICGEVKKEDNRTVEGVPAINTQVCILDKNKKLTPRGVIGELYLSGSGMAKGYLREVNSTNSGFMKHIFKKDRRMYRTGDLAKMHFDGQIEIVGRIDNQINIRGYRIEPGEIEALITVIPAVKQAVVVQNHDLGLTAYYEVKDGERVSKAHVKKNLVKQLPEYMVPEQLVQAKIPYNKNGKPDRLKLSKQAILSTRNNKSAMPHSVIEKSIADIWNELLPIKNVSMDDDFFMLGGHSLKAMHLLSKINNKFNIELTLRFVFDNSKLSEQCERIREQIIEESTVGKILD